MLEDGGKTPDKTCSSFFMKISTEGAVTSLRYDAGYFLKTLPAVKCLQDRSFASYDLKHYSLLRVVSSQEKAG